MCSSWRGDDGTIVNVAAICVGSSPNQLLSPITSSLRKALGMSRHTIPLDCGLTYKNSSVPPAAVQISLP
jgi:hypothetical protein